jgi:deoxyribose-phosphate aldolase
VFHNSSKNNIIVMDITQIEKIVQVITREVLIALNEEDNNHTQAQGDHCTEECAEGICVKTCYDRVGKVVSAGAERITSSLGGIPPEDKISSMIDHTLLQPDATTDQIAQLCFEARKYQFATVCVNPIHVALCAKLLKNIPVKVCTVIGFPLGASAPKVKAFEAQNAFNDGATEIDMVINIGALKSRDYDIVAQDIRGVVEVSHAQGVLVKVILETGLLNQEEIVTACLLAKEAGADFVKTSTGFGEGGATVEDIALMRKAVGPEMGVKASGGVHSFQDAQDMAQAGATRIGASAGVKIVSGANGQTSESDANQENKKRVWDFWQELENAKPDNIANILRAYLPEDVFVSGPDPIKHLVGIDMLNSKFWQPLLKSFPDIKRESYIFFGGKSNGRADGHFDGQEWVCGLGHFKGTFEHDWLTIPASGKETEIRWSEFCRMHAGQIVEIHFLLDIPDVMRQAGFPVLPPDRGDPDLWPPPRANDGVLLATQDEQETQLSMKLIRNMIYAGLNNFNQSALESMGMAQFFHPQLQWYGPSGIGGCRSFKEFEEFHQKHWLHAFSDRQVQDLDNLFTEGRYMGASSFPGVLATHNGQYLDAPATGNIIKFNGIDIWLREGDEIVENWVFVDMIDIFRQFGIDLFETMRISASDRVGEKLNISNY